MLTAQPAAVVVMAVGMAMTGGEAAAYFSVPASGRHAWESGVRGIYLSRRRRTKKCLRGNEWTSSFPRRSTLLFAAAAAAARELGGKNGGKPREIKMKGRSERM